MSDVERTKGLMLTDDAMVWAEEFCRIFVGAVIAPADDTVVAGNLDTKVVGPGTMVGWFANAMQVAIDMDKARKARIAQATANIPQSEKDAFVEGFTDGRDRPTDLDDPTS